MRNIHEYNNLIKVLDYVHIYITTEIFYERVTASRRQDTNSRLISLIAFLITGINIFVI